MAIESLSQQAATFVDSLSIKPASTEKTADEYSQEAKTPLQGDTVTISEEARALVAMENPGESNQSDQETDMDQTIQTLKDQIDKLEKEIDELEEKDMPEKQKLTQTQENETRLMELREQLLKAQQTKLKADGQSDTGGTKAKGFGNSVKDF